MTIGLKLEEENVPQYKRYMISTRGNSEYKWQAAPHVIGALEVPSDPYFNLSGDFTVRHVSGKEDAFDKALDDWRGMSLKSDFQKAAENGPKETCCCGALPDDDETIKCLVPALNKGWVKRTNTRLLDEQKHFTLDVFLWQWHNATGKSETNILLIRFFSSQEVAGFLPLSPSSSIK